MESDHDLRVDVREFAGLLRKGPKTQLTLDHWFSRYPEATQVRKRAGVTDARRVYNLLRTPEHLLELSAKLSEAGCLPPDLFERARETVRAVSAKKDGTPNEAGEAAAFRRVIPFKAMLQALRAYRGAPSL